ncbi:SprT family zinc-dependent metalloprotease [Xinfangfangia sp. CPCC 101601]|uniref:SprT family zinc-dependent metalloprotease n=1 Tax=Pseudogemmobacter lacusdianii TaxID=3069608 RepID=A0ABU0VZ18_9RHOB|nr:SprT family zinc-dependent metalloprotease [Xinfangfangia sp. CPCC 101601]MDQ2066150.1 SprT family zinc-dependent metalloprotease [Xinfangfangia sp. CPCC 101601]
MPVLPGDPPIEVHLRRSAQARRFSLRVSRLDGKVTLSLPTRAREREALAFLAGQEGWLRRTLGEMPESQRAGVGIGSLVPVEGRMLELVQGTGRAIKVDGDQLLVPGDPARAGVRLQAWLKVLARDRLAIASTRYAAQLGRSYARLSLRDTRSRWGSCSHDGTLMYSWRLIMAPPSVLDYVAAHECAHLIEMNHSPAFWAVVESIYPNWQRQRGWLHDQGSSLHRYRFASTTSEPEDRD